MFKKFLTALIALPLLAAASINVASAQDMVMEVESPLGFQETFDKLIANAKGQGWKAPKKWRKNFQKNLKHVTKVDIGPGMVLEICEPHAAVKLLKHDKYKKFLSMMPCTISVYTKSDGKTYISMMNIRGFAAAYPDSQEIKDMVTELAPQMDAMIKMQ